MAEKRKKPKKLGRPTLPDSERKSRRLDDVRFSPAELARLRQQAGTEPWSAWVRAKLGLS